jgi:hypothetical protein
MLRYALIAVLTFIAAPAFGQGKAADKPPEAGRITIGAGFPSVNP